MAKSQRGFAGMDPAAQREIARAGGRAAHRSGHAHEFTPEEAAEAGRKGGRARHQKNAARKAQEAAQMNEAGAPGESQMNEAAQRPVDERAMEQVRPEENNSHAMDMSSRDQRGDLSRNNGQLGSARPHDIENERFGLADENEMNRRENDDDRANMEARTSAARRGSESEQED